MERVVLPFSGLASWVLILGGVLATLQVLGINIQPLLTVGGVSGIVVGLSAQSVMSNMISGINLVSRMVATLGCALCWCPHRLHTALHVSLLFPLTRTARTTQGHTKSTSCSLLDYKRICIRCYPEVLMLR